MTYEYVKRTYGVSPEAGGIVRHTVLNRLGTICRENKSASHYVQVRFDGQRHKSPCHPTELEYLTTEHAIRTKATP